MSATLMAKQITVTAAALAKIAADASFLWERLDRDLYTVNPDQDNQTEIDRRCNRWCQTVAHENQPDILQKRLQWDGLTLDNIRPYLGNVQLTPGQPLSPWAETLRHIIQTASTVAPDPAFPWPTSPEHPIPFEDIWLPAIQVARQNLLTRLGSAQLTPDTLPLLVLADKAYSTLERTLLQRLSQISDQTLDLEFSKDRSFGQNLLNLLGIEETETAESNSRYQQFVDQLLQDGLLNFFQTYPVLGRLIAVAVDLWVDATAEFIQRLIQDQADIQHQFSPMLEDFEHQQASLGKVTAIKTFLSDPHNQGRTVLLLTFDSGLNLVYKPKDLGLEVAWNQFLTWCNQHSSLLDLKVLQILNRDDYGWVEFVDHLPCTDADAVARFYQRAGMLLCLIYVLQGTDCHHKNLIASGEHLVLIDMEALLHHDANLIENSPEIALLETESVQLFWNSVLRTGLLPRWDFSVDQRFASDISGLGHTEQQQTTCKLPRWQAINTDNMHQLAEAVTLPIGKNVPHLGETPLSPNQHQAQIVAGFEQMYRFLITHQPQLLSANGPLANLQHQRVRFVMRATRIYFILLQRAWAPDYLKHGADYSIELDHLSRAFVLAHEKPAAWPLLQAERQAMEQLDIPFFTANTSGDALPINADITIPQYFKQASYDAVAEQVHTLNETNLAQQVAIIQGAFYAKVAHSATHDSQPQLSGDAPLLNREQLMQAARDIATDLEARALQDADGSLNWISMGFVPQAERFQLQVLNDSLYDGRCGVALFLSGLYEVTQEPHFRDLALRVLHPLQQRLQAMDTRSRQRYVRLMGLGGAAGVGSLLYSLVKISQFLDDETLLADAQTLAVAITPELITADQALDIIGGAAGGILGLLTLYQAMGETVALQRAIACGEHLLSQQTTPEAGPKAWKTIAEKPLTGFSHGAAGIAYALLRLYAAIGAPRYRDAALEGMAYEHSVFSKSQANWPDLRDFNPDDSPTFPVQWCHGAAGIGLGRLGSVEILQTEVTNAMMQDLQIALQTTQQQGLKGIDHLCCGNLGIAEVLLVGANKGNRPDWRQAALQKAAAVVTRANQSGAYQLFANLPNAVFNSGFFQGTSGIGYQLLRLANDDLPSVLLWT